MKNVGVLLSGCGVYDGSEIHEAVFTLYHLEHRGYQPVCYAPDADQLHVVNHLTGQPTTETRNILHESARIARGSISSLSEVRIDNLDALVLPGGFGTAKNHTDWAINGPNGNIRDDVRSHIQWFVEHRKPVVGLCMAPTTIAKALQGTATVAHLTVGSTEESSPYDIADISAGLELLGAHAYNRTVQGIMIDTNNKIITAPCYMMTATIVDIFNNVGQAIEALDTMLRQGES